MPKSIAAVHSVPAICKKCGSVFVAQVPFGLGPGVTLVLSGGGFATCPVCHEFNELNNVAYRVTSEAVAVLTGAGITRSSVEKLRAIADQAVIGRISRAQAIKQAAAISPRYGTILEAFEKFGLPGLILLATILGVYLASADMQKIENAVSRQTVILEQVIEAIKKQSVAPRVEGDGAPPPSAKTEQQSSSVKAPPKRPAKVRNRDRQDRGKHQTE